MNLYICVYRVGMFVLCVVKTVESRYIKIDDFIRYGIYAV